MRFDREFFLRDALVVGPEILGNFLIRKIGDKIIKTKIVEVPIGESFVSMNKKLDKLVETKIINSYEDLCDPKTDKFLFIIKHDSKFGALSEDEILEKRLDWTRKSIKDIEFIERKFHELKENVSE